MIIVFLEEATATSCDERPKKSYNKILHDARKFIVFHKINTDFIFNR